MRSSKSKLGYAVVTAAALSAGAAHAAEKEMLDACAQYFIAANLAVYPGKISVDTSSAGYAPLISPTQQHYQVAIKTLNPANGEQLASGVCTVSRTGKVIAFKPTSVMSTKLAASLQPATVAKVE